MTVIQGSPLCKEAKIPYCATVGASKKLDLAVKGNSCCALAQ